MKGSFWNCNGFADGKKYRYLSDLTKEKSLDFIALSETGRANIPQTTLNNICAGRDFICTTTLNFTEADVFHYPRRSKATASDEKSRLIRE